MPSLLLPMLGCMPGSTTRLLHDDDVAVLCARRVEDGWVEAETVSFSSFALGVAVAVAIDAAHRDLVPVGYACPFEVDAGPFFYDAAASHAVRC